MLKNNVPTKVAIGYGIVALIFVVAIYLVYSNTQSIININKSSQEYSRQREVSDNMIAQLLKEEQANLQQLTEVYQQKNKTNLIHQKVNQLNSGKDSVIVHPTTTKTHEAQQTVVEVVKTRKGFFRRLADAFKKGHKDTISIKKDSNKTTTDTIVTPVNVGHNVADVLAEINQKEQHASQAKDKAVSKEIADLQMVNAQLALQSNQQLKVLHQRERESLQRALEEAVNARNSLLLQICLLAMIAIVAAIVLCIYIWKDTQKERAYRENLEQAKEETLRIMEQRERLLLTITHDIKAPAASISGFIDLLREYVTAPKGIAYLCNIHQSAQHLSQLVAALLDYHQLENGLMELHPVSFNLSQLISHSVESMQPKAEEKGLHIHCLIKPHKEGIAPTGIMCRADAFRIRQIMDNLISNAIKYTDQGSISIAAHIEKTGKQHFLTLKITDTGCGMTQEESQKIFTAFTRLKGAQGIEGVGLGLSITRELVALLQGEIHLTSQKGKGSTFTVTFPIELSEENTEGISQQKKNFKNNKILLLDDDALQLQLLQEMLKRTSQPWEIFTCNHITDALNIISTKQPSLLMMDIEMPEMNGIDFIKHINHSNMTVVAMTAHDVSILPQLKKAGFDDCLFKPFDISQLCHILGEESTPTITEKKASQGKDRFNTLLSFAENDPEAEKEIIEGVRQDLASHHALFTEMVEKGIDLRAISQTAHKLMPIASMLHLECLSALSSLTPEHIHEQEETEIRASILSINREIEKILEEIKKHAPLYG